MTEAQATTGKRISKRIRFGRLLRVVTALAALALLIFLVWKLYHIYQLSAEKIYDKSYVPYRFAPAVPADTALFTTIELYYAEGDYSEVIRQSKSLLSVRDHERLLIGLAYLHEEEYLPAISWLNRLAEQEGSPYQQPAQFYLTLTHLKNKDYDRTIELMQLILDDPAHRYHKRFTPADVSDVSLLKWR